MHVGDTIVFELPGTEEFGAGRVEEFAEVGMTEVPKIKDLNDKTYPVHPANITDVNHVPG